MLDEIDYDYEFKPTKIFARIRAIIGQLNENTTIIRAPITIFEFINRLSQGDKIVPLDWLLLVERRNFDFAPNGTLK